MLAKTYLSYQYNSCHQLAGNKRHLHQIYAWQLQMLYSELLHRSIHQMFEVRRSIDNIINVENKSAFPSS